MADPVSWRLESWAEERERLLEGLTQKEAETLSRILRKLSATWLPVTGTLGAAGG